MLRPPRVSKVMAELGMRASVDRRLLLPHVCDATI